MGSRGFFKTINLDKVPLTELSDFNLMGNFFTLYMPTMRMYFLILQEISIIIRAIRKVKFVVAVHKFKK